MWFLFIEHINTSFRTQCEAIYWQMPFFSITVCKYHHKQFACCWKGQQYTFTALPEAIATLHPCTSLVYRNLDCLSLTPYILLVHYINDIMLTETIV